MATLSNTFALKHGFSLNRTPHHASSTFRRHFVVSASSSFANDNREFVIVGGGNAAGYAARTFVEQDMANGKLCIVSKEAHAPYERPALTKGYLFALDKKPARLPGFHTCVGSGGERQTPDWYKEHGIEMLYEDPVTGIDIEKQTLTTNSGKRLKYGSLIIATGCTASRFPEKIGGNLPGVHYIRDVADADSLISSLGKARKVVVVGGGYIGMEVAAAAVGWKLDTTVIFPENQFLQRLFTPSLAQKYAELYQENGVKLIKGASIKNLEVGSDGNVAAVKLENGSTIEADTVVVGIGAKPAVGPFEKVGLDTTVGGIQAGEFFQSAQRSAATQQRELESDQSAEASLETPLLADQEMTSDQTKQVKLGFLTGLVPKEKTMAFERILFRATRGNVFLKKAAVDEPVIDPVSGEKADKNVFAVFFSGERAKNKILKICEAFGANRYPFSEDFGKQAQMITEVSGRLSELRTTIDAGLLLRGNLLQTIGEHYEQWSLLVRKEKSIYHTLNMLSIDVTKKCLVAEGWSPIYATKQIQDALQRATCDSNSQIGAIFQVLQTKELPPTYFRTNKFTSAFQEIVDAYGVAKYQEANPGVFTIVTFPFLFAVMFGDWGHGICLLLVTLYFIFREKKLSSQKLDDITEMTFGGRYVILMMSLFSIYTGLIYNEFFSVPFELFSPSAYVCRDPQCRDSTTIGLIKARDTYPFGVDPAWHGSRSELPFLNSLKMKMSILLGVAQMNLGIIISFFNALYFRSCINVWFQFIPQMIFLNGLFGYLSLLIIIKWCTGSQADLYHVMIYMFLSPTDELGDNELFSGQRTVQLVLLLLSLVAVPWMMLPKPFLLKAEHEKRHQGQSYTPLESTVDSLQVEAATDSHGHEEFEFSEVFVHQLIHTIEFVLGAVSNTASYLRLWALSLAHSELSSVFYEKVLLLAWGYNNIIFLIIGIIVFIFATVGVLLVMETLSAFLHALRLHWVEFQNKFYEGDGYKFSPFAFALMPDEEE